MAVETEDVAPVGDGLKVDGDLPVVQDREVAQLDQRRQLQPKELSIDHRQEHADKVGSQDEVREGLNFVTIFVVRV